MPVDVKYTTSATATGGRDGRSKTEDGSLDVKLATPKELGGGGGSGNNPEQLFAAGYAACFHSALKLVARQQEATFTDSAVTAEVGIGPIEPVGFGLSVALHVEVGGVDQATAEELVAAAHQVCPYSNATRGNIAVDVRLA